jgi:hypothetical protein
MFLRQLGKKLVATLGKIAGKGAIAKVDTRG